MQLPRKHYQTTRDRSSESGIALLTVTALLAIFAIILTGFIYTIRMEEITVKNYAQSVNVQQAAESAIQGVLGQLSNDLSPGQEHVVLGRLQPKYVSQLDPWYLGYEGQTTPEIRYDARAFMKDERPEAVVQRTGLRILPTPIPRGIDEDPPGDVTGQRRIGYAGRGDNKPGLGGIDDNRDGITGETKDQADLLNPFDDDEDFRTDEDHYDVRRDGLFFTPGTGYDNDGDLVGVFDESAKINLNFAGNNNGSGGSFVYNQGVGPNELDLPVFLYQRIVQYSRNGSVAQFSESQAEQLAQYIVNFRNGSVSDGGVTVRKPGEDNKDDNNNNNPKILEVQDFDQAFNTPNFNGQPFAIVGNDADDDDDGLTNEEDETYIAATTINSSGTPLDGPIEQRSGNLEDFRPGNRIDDNGNGYIDEEDEGIDDPSEFDVYKPKGDDRPFATLDDLKLLQPMRGVSDAVPPRLESPPPTMFNILRNSTTIWSQSDEVAGPLSGKNNEVGKINPNAAYNWRALDTWNVGGGKTKVADFQYGPPLSVRDMFVLQVDNDQDWQHEAEADVTNGKPDGIDNDGDGLIDEPSDDWDGNFYPSPDFDGFGEADLGSPEFLENGKDDDLDGETRDGTINSQDAEGRLRRLPRDKTDYAQRPRDVNDNDIRPGMVIEGNGQDDDGDNLIDDDGDFNGDKMLTYDPEWHLNEDDFGDLSGDGYPGLGGDPDAKKDSAEGDIVTAPQERDDFLYTSFADDDWDGFADFDDPQVLAAMYAPELDGVDNDGDGQVDEIGERYIAAYDDDEDGRMDEDPAEFQIALNLIDFVDTWGPYTPAEDDDVRQVLGKTEDDAVLSDPVTFQTLELYTSRQRAFRMHPRLLTGPNAQAKDRQLFIDEMKYLLPNPPQTGLKVTYEGVESIRINEVLAQPVIRLEMEDVLESIQYDPSDPNTAPVVTAKKGRFIEPRPRRGGAGDNGQLPGVPADTQWSVGAISSRGGFSFPFPNLFLPQGFQNTFNPVVPMANLDALAPAFIFMVTNVAPQATQVDPTIAAEDEEGQWVFENIPAGFYDVVVYIHPNNEMEPEVEYYFNEKRIPMKSDTAVVANGVKTPIANLQTTDPATYEVLRRDTARWDDRLHGSTEFPLPYRLTYWPGDAQTFSQRFGDPKQGRVEVKNDGKLTLRILAKKPDAAVKPYYVTSIDRIELINPYAQYVELVNIGMDDVDLGGWTINTPYGHYVLPQDTVIHRMKPAYEGDDGQDRLTPNGMPGIGVPFEPMIDQNRLGNPISNQDLRMEDNKILLAYNAAGLRTFISDNYPEIYQPQDRIFQPVLATNEKADIERSLKSLNPADPKRPNAQVGDEGFRLFDYQEDVLTDNPRQKMVTLYDPAGNYIDSFRYRTTFNNAVVDIPNMGANLDIVALPGYTGFQAYERTDPTYFRTQSKVDAITNTLSAERFVPSNMILDAKDAMVVNLVPDRAFNFKRGAFGGYTDRNRGTESDPNNRSISRFQDRLMGPFSAGFHDAWWNGWDFIGDSYEYNRDLPKRDAQYRTAMERSASMAREAGSSPSAADKVLFYDMLGGFENFTNVQDPRQVQYTAFIWRVGLRELIRAGYDPDVDDHLTVKVLGRQYVTRVPLIDSGKTLAHAGDMLPFDMPVGEVLVNPAFNLIDPGLNPIGKEPESAPNPDDPYFVGSRSTSRMPVFAKLRNGDTAFTIDLRKDYRDLWSDLQNSSESEPQVEIAVVMRKSTKDVASPINPQITQQDRPDLSTRTQMPLRDRNGDGQFEDSTGQLLAMGSAGDDNYFFRGVELFGRGRGPGLAQQANPEKTMQYLAGTPGRDNTGYTPAYPRRRLDLRGTSRDEFDVIDNTAYVKNGPLATIGELSRLYTGKKFETVNTPIIPQRLEDAAMQAGRVLSNPALAKRVGDSNDQPDYRIQLAQRERLDQWENQYTPLYDLITTALDGVVPGKINVNTAQREVLAALPFTPPASPGKLENLRVRSEFNLIAADYILEGRQPTGHDTSFGVQGLNDDLFLSGFLNYQRDVDTISEFKLKSVGREPTSFKLFTYIKSQRFNKLNIKPQDVYGTQVDLKDAALTAWETAPDDGPYENLGTLFEQITHLRRRERYSDALKRAMDRTGDGKPDGAGDLRDRLNSEMRRELTPEDMEAMMNRISNLVTVKSRAFGVVAQGRIYDKDGTLVAQRKLESVYSSR